MKKDSGQKPRKQGFDPKDIVNDHIPCVYGPSPEKMRQRRREIEERNRQRRMQREREAQDCDARIEKVYGPMPPTPSVNDARKENIEELVDMPMEDLYGPMPPIGEIVTIPKKEEKEEDKKGEKEEVAEEKRGFFARFFGKKRS